MWKKRCKTCVWFGVLPGESFGSCENEKVAYGTYGADDELIVIDYEDMDVGQNFGCVHHKKVSWFWLWKSAFCLFFS